ncbi:Os08g0207401, partial [Oryza sativa Japonica Group]
MGVAVRGVRVHVDVAGVLGAALLDPGGARGVGGVVDGARLLEVGPAVVPGGDGVDHHGGHGRGHGDEPGEREPASAAPASAARRSERVERGGEDVHHAGGEDDARRERLDGEEHVAVGPERGERPPQHGHQHPRRARRQDGRDGDELEPQRPARVLPRHRRRRRITALAPGHRRRRRRARRRHGQHQHGAQEQHGPRRALPHGVHGARAGGVWGGGGGRRRGARGRFIGGARA